MVTERDRAVSSMENSVEENNTNHLIAEILKDGNYHHKKRNISSSRITETN